MGLIIKIVLGLTALVSMALSSAGFKNNNFFTGLLFVIIAIIALIFLLRFLWELMGCVVTISLIGGLVGLILYVSGAFSGGAGLLPDSVSSLLGVEKEPPANQTLYGQATALTGDAFKMGDKIFYLYGVSAPKLNQTCLNSVGNRYGCGTSAHNFLQEKIQNQEPVCTVLGSAPSIGNALPAICNVGKYDLGALMVAGGWAIPSLSGGMAYVAYEAEAKKRKLGLWQGRFSSPWEWERNLQNQQQRMQSIKVQQPKKEQSLLMQSFWN